jgi:adenine-specific DNA-methyltransferase
MSRKQKLELTWIGKEERPRLEPRIFVEAPENSHHASVRTSKDIFDNMLIKGDNLLALKALQSEFAGRIKCIYIDPPYNTGSMMENYDDNLEHSIWLSMMRERLDLLRDLLADDGIIFVQIDDNEVGYLLVLMDQLFGRVNRMNIVAVKMSEATGVKMSHADKRFPKTKEFILVYKKNLQPKIKPIRVSVGKWNDEYKEIILGLSEGELNELKALMEQDRASETDVKRADELLRDARIQSLAQFFRENGIAAAEQENWRWSNAWRICQAVGAGSIKERAVRKNSPQSIAALLSAQNKLYIYKADFNKDSKDPRIRVIFADKYLQYNPGDFWTDIKTTGGVGEEGGVYFPKGKKPEQLIRRIIECCTEQGDWVLDSFAGSGTTLAVAHKLRRRWIGVEIGDHADTHILPRLRRVVDGNDNTGITTEVAWKGGGGFRFSRLSPSLLQRDKWGNWVISKEYNATMLAEAVCKHMGFTYAPSQVAAEYWKHGTSSERDFIYVTTQSLTHAMLTALSRDVGPDRHLLICCKAYSGKVGDFPNLTVRKIPQAVLATCEWGRDDYSLRIANLPVTEPEPEPDKAEDVPQAPRKKPGRKPEAVSTDNPSLFEQPAHKVEA